MDQGSPAPVVTDQGAVQSEGAVAPVQSPAQEQVVVPVVLDSLDKFQWHGQEWTPEKLNAATLMQSDYTKKTQALANEQKYINNIGADLATVKSNPAQADAFRKLYPDRYHHLLDLVLEQAEMAEAAGYESEANADVSDPFKSKLLALEKRLEQQDRQLAEKFHNEKVESVNVYLDSLFNKLQTKYDLADEDAVVNRAQRLLDENRENPLFKMTDAAWERLFRQDHELRDRKYSERMKSRISEQTKVGQRSQDVGPGGASVGHSRKRMSFDEATEAAIQDLRSRG